jgi:hypothetical protein
VTTATELRERLQTAAGRAGVPVLDDVAAADDVIARARTARRTRAAVASVLACAALAAVLVATLGGNAARAPVPTEDLGTPAVVVRGSLGADRAFTEAVRVRGWPPTDVPTGPFSGHRVVFAGDAGGYRWVLVTAETDGTPQGVWFTGPEGAAAADLRPISEGTVLPDLPVAVAQPDARGATLLLLSRPGDRVLVSPGAVVGADGVTRREYTAVATQDGISVTRVAGTFAAAAARYRVLRGGSPVATGSFGGTYTELPAVAALARTTPLRPSTGPVSQDAVADALSGVLTATGLGPDDVHPVLLETQRLATSIGGELSLAVVASSMPSGALVVTAGASAPYGGTRGCAPVVHRAGIRPADVVVATSCIADIAGTATQRSFVVSAPPDADRVTLLADDGTVLAQQALSGGSGVVPDPGTVATAVVTGPRRADVRVPVPSNSQGGIDVD